MGNPRPIPALPRLLGPIRLSLALLLTSALPLAAQEQLLFPARDDARAAILQKIRNEHVRLDIALWLFVDREIAMAIVGRHQAGVPVRVIGDRASIFEGDPNTRAEFEFLATNGVPIRLRYRPTDVLEIMHWKCGIFVGQGTVEFGSANWTGFELAPWSPTNFKDETVMFTDDPVLFRAFLTKFDEMWGDPDTFLDWPEAYRLETGRVWTTPMAIPQGRLEPDHPTNIPGMIWSQGSELIDAMVAEIEREPQAIDVVSYRLSARNLTDALIARHQAGVAVRMMVEPMQYRNDGFPEYELVGAETDRLWAAGVPIRQRHHDGLTHMKTLITSRVALNGSANFTRFWQRDHNYFIPAAGKPALHLAMKDRFSAMWNDTRNFVVFRPLPPASAAPVAPGRSAGNVPLTTKLEWKRASWAVAFDVFMGTSAEGLSFAGRVDAHVNEWPPATYSFTPPQPLQPSTTYYWRVRSRTYATDRDPSVVAWSEIWSFTTGNGTGGPGPGPVPAGPPFGVIDTPGEGAAVAGEVPLTGWALDDSGIAAVEIYRSPVGAEPVQSNGLVFVGTATFIEGARPDVAAAFPGYPGATRAGWGLMVLSNFLPNGGTGIFVLHAFARSNSGELHLLGSRTIVATNATSTVPFGTIDTPAQGETVSGVIVNFGWVLTPQPSVIAFDGSTIEVYVDGIMAGHPVYNNFRSDIAAMFPGLANSNGAVGYFVIDTRALSNGVHTISWLVRDSAGRTQGVGSRFFTVANP